MKRQQFISNSTSGRTGRRGRSAAKIAKDFVLAHAIRRAQQTEARDVLGAIWTQGTVPRVMATAPWHKGQPLPMLDTIWRHSWPCMQDCSVYLSFSSSLFSFSFPYCCLDADEDVALLKKKTFTSLKIVVSCSLRFCFMLETHYNPFCTLSHFCPTEY